MEPPPDLEDVYRPFEDPGLKNVEEQTEFREHELGELGDLLGLGRSTQDSSEVATSGSGGVVDLSFQEKAEQAKAAPQVAQAAVKAKVASRAQSAPVAEGGEAMKRIPANAKGFGSDDLFGNAEPQDDSLFQTMCKMLPEQVTQRVDCLAVSTAKGLEVEVPVLDPVTAEHAATAANRSVEGRWVPTYMRQQLAAGGHTSLPSAPNGHEFSASAQPPSCGQAFIDMGHDFGEGAQAVLEFMAAFFTSLTFQCQACSHHAISTAHEQVMVLGDDWCGFAETEDDVMEHIRTVPNGLAAEAGQAYRDTSGVPNARSEGREGGPGGPGPGGPGPADSGEALRAPALAQPAFGAFSSFDKLEPKIEVGRVDKDLLMQVASTI